jgi:putative transposase
MFHTIKIIIVKQHAIIRRELTSCRTLLDCFYIGHFPELLNKGVAIAALSFYQIYSLIVSDRYNDDRLHETVGIERSDKGQHRIGDYWQDYVKGVYEQSIKDKHPMAPCDVVREVHRHAVIDLRHEEGDYPHQATIYRILKPLIDRQKRKNQIRNPGSGSWMCVETRDGQLLKADFSNQIVQCDHTKLDVRIVDRDGKLLNWRPWLTTVVDTFSSCLIGYHLWHKQPGSHEVALTLRHAALPKQYSPEYGLQKTWDICGLPLQHFFTDGGKDLARSKLIKAFGKKFGFQCELRDRPIQGGIVERLFGTINTEVLRPLAFRLRRSWERSPV